MREAGISINGREVSDAQAAVIRIALTGFRQENSDSNALGDDAHGRAMTKAYFDRASEVLRLIHE